jgi:transcriptional regulator with XRE-family HTH domain
MGMTSKKMPSARKNLVGDRVRMARAAFNPPLTQDQLAGKLAGIKVLIDRPGVTKLENGTRRVFDFEVVALAQVLVVDVSWLLGLTQASSIPTQRKGNRA